MFFVFFGDKRYKFSKVLEAGMVEKISHTTNASLYIINYTVILQNDRFLIRVKKKFVDSLWKLLKFWLFFRSIPPLKKNLPIIFISAIFGFVLAETKDR